MPKKLNKAGQQQNYVPAGNGDASGEYGDNATGSNIHFTAFKKPDDEKPIDNQNEESKRIKEEQNKKTREEYTDFVKRNSTFKGKMLEQFNEMLENGNDESIEMLNKAYQKNPYRYDFKIGKGVYDNGTIKCDKNDILGNTSYGKRGHTWFHENGHLLDWVKGYPPLSYKFKDENGKTLNDYVREETKELYNSGIVDELLEEKANIRKNVLAELGYDEEKFEALREKKKIETDKFSNSVYGKEIHNKYMKLLDDKWNGNITSEEYKKRYYEIEELTAKNINEHPELIDANVVQECNKVMKQFTENYDKASKDYLTKYITVSDALSSQDKSGNWGLGVGHSPKYYSQRYWGAGAEFFANTFSAFSVNKDELETIKKYYPKSYAMYEKVLKEVQNG